MSRSEHTFVERCLLGEALLDDLDDAVEQWHTGGTNCSLEEHLGLTQEEYAVLVENPDALRAIVHSRKTNVALVDALEWTEGTALAARARSRTEEKQVLSWLRNTRKIP